MKNIDVNMGIERIGILNSSEKQTFATDRAQGTVGYHAIGGHRAQLKPATWSWELQYLEDQRLKQFLWEGVNNRFSVIDDSTVIEPYDCKKYRSATQGAAQEFISKLMKKELAEEKLMLATTTPVCIHSIGAVPKRMEASDRSRIVAGH